MNIVTVFNQIRSKTEGDPAAAHQAAQAAGLPQAVIEYIAPSTSWRQYQTAFRLLCTHMTTNESLPRFWRAAAFESLGATHPADDPGGRIYYLDSADEMVDDIGDVTDDDQTERLYIETCVNAGRNETVGTTPSLEVFERVANVMIALKWFNAPGRLKALLDELAKKKWVVDDATIALIERFKQAEASGNHAFSPRQTKILKEAYPNFFPAAA